MVNNAATIHLENNRLMISGDLDFLTVMQLWQSSLSLLKTCSEFHFDFSEVHFSNSAGLALFVEWLKLARKNNKSICFTNIPKDLLSVAESCGMEKIIKGQ